MKLVPMVETTDPGYGNRTPSFRRYDRPLETEADLIAAALDPGDVTTQQMIRIKRLDGDHVDGHLADDCSMCDPDMAYAIWYELRQEWNSHLEIFGVTWDPDIRL